MSLPQDAVSPADQIARLQRQNEQLERGLASARAIGAATGIVMARSGRTYDDAFALLLTVSQHRNVKVRDLAEQVMLTGEVPDDS